MARKQAAKKPIRLSAKGTPIGGARPGAGRPSLYTSEIVDRICRELMEGKSLIKICDADDMPHRVTVVTWLGDPDKRDFLTRYACAKETQAEYMDDLILDVAHASTPESSPADRVKIAAFQWRAAKLQPKKYGDRVHKEVTGADGGAVKINVTGMNDEQLAAIEAALTESNDTRE